MARMSMFLHEIGTFPHHQAVRLRTPIYVIIWSFPDVVIAFRIKTVKRFQIEIQVTEINYESLKCRKDVLEPSNGVRNLLDFFRQLLGSM